VCSLAGDRERGYAESVPRARAVNLIGGGRLKHKGPQRSAAEHFSCTWDSGIGRGHGCAVEV
jgi:hypothetical protein